MGKKEEQKVSNFRPLYYRDKEQKCFIGHTYNASWHTVIVEVCDEVLPTFGLHPWYADAHYTGASLCEKVMEMIATTQYGIYDLSYWRANEQSTWEMPHNVLIELGMAIALNRPTLLLRHAENRVSELALPDCLQSVESSFCEFTGGKKSLRDVLTTRLPHWIKRSPEQEWQNRYCLFGSMVCDYRDTHSLSPHTIQNNIACYIADGQDTDRDDFRASVEEIIERFDNVECNYLNAYSLPHGYNFSLCSQCQLVRSTPFAIYRLTTQTPAEVFIMIGMSIALEAQFRYKIPKLLLTENLEHVPSLIRDNEFVITRNDQELRARLTQLLPQVIQRARETMWRPQALPLEINLLLNDFCPIEAEDLVAEEIHSPEVSETSCLYDFSLICSSDGQEWVTWICWILEQANHTISAAKIANTTELREAITIARKQAKHTVLILSSDILNKLPGLLDIFSMKSRILAVQIHQNKLQPAIARRLTILDLSTKLEQDARRILLSQISSNDPLGFRENISLSEEGEYKKPRFPTVVEQSEKKAVEIFYCYAHKDERLRKEFDKHLFNLMKQGLINGWYDRDISAGTEWAHEIDMHLDSAQIILLLISPDFLASEYCYSIEMMRALERHDTGEAFVIPVLIQPVDWQGAPFKKLQALPKNAKPVTRWRNRADAFLDITKGIREAIKAFNVNTN